MAWPFHPAAAAAAAALGSVDSYCPLVLPSDQSPLLLALTFVSVVMVMRIILDSVIIFAGPDSVTTAPP
jgi:hypothetical protein